MPAQMLPKSIATPGLLSHIIISKYADHQPLYRQEKIFERLGVELKRQTMASWVIKIAESCEALLDLLRAEIRSGPLIQIDETPVQVLKEPGRPATTKSYMWLFRGGSQLPDTLKSAIVRQFKNMKEEHLLSLYSHSDFVNRTKQADSILNLKNIQAETLLLVGQNDTIVDKADVVRAAQIIPNCRFMVLENAGHFLHFENKNILPIYKDFFEKSVNKD